MMEAVSSSNTVNKELDAGTVSIPEPHYSLSEPQNKMNVDYNAQNSVSRSKEILEEATPKGIQSQLPTSANNDDHSSHPVMQRSISAAATYHRNRQNISGAHSTPSAMPSDTQATPSDSAPTIQVVPSSPLTSNAGSASRHESHAGSLASGGEISTRSERRASRHRSEMEVSYCRFLVVVLLTVSSLADVKPQAIRVFLKPLAS